MTIIGVALLGFLLLAIIGRLAAQIILISAMAGMVLLGGGYLIRHSAVAPMVTATPSDSGREYLTNGSPDYDSDGTPTTDGIMRRIHRMFPTR